MRIPKRSIPIAFLVAAACAGGAPGAPPAMVALEAPAAPLFVGEWQELAVAIRPGAPFVFGDLRFEIAEGASGGSVSLSQPDRAEGEAPTVMLMAGAAPGRFTLRALHRNVEQAKVTYDVTDQRTSDGDGPRLWFSGTSGPRYGARGQAWGGGPNEIQNVNVIPQAGTRRVAILFVDNATQRYTQTPQQFLALKDRWLANLVGGVESEGRGRTSVARYYREMSGGKLDVTAEAFGPVHMPGTFDDYFKAGDKASFKGDFAQQCLTAGDPLIDYTQFDTVLCVSPAVNMNDPATRRAAWPSASLAEWGPYKTNEGDVAMGIISMSAEWTEIDGRQLFATISHELGHNLGLRDQYQPAVSSPITGWDLMDWDGDLPQLSIAHRLMLGWIDPAHVLSFNIARLDATHALGGRYTLDPIEKIVPFENLPVERHLIGLEFRLADGLNHYFEYRRGQAGMVGDRAGAVPQAGGGVVVDSVVGARTSKRPEITLRAAIQQLPDDPSRATVVEFEREQTGYRASLESANADAAVLELTYGTFRPDVAIRPWPAGPDRQWQSPDIEVTNARAKADPSWRNVPWIGHDNNVLVTVHNGGNLASNASVYVEPKNYNVGGVPDGVLSMSTTIGPIQPGAALSADLEWTPQEGGHRCLDVTIGGSAADASTANHRAQSNYTRFFSDSASPARRVVTEVEIGNPWDKATVAFVTAYQTGAAFRTYLEHTWLQLGPREIRKVKVMFEYAGNDPAGAAPVSQRAINNVNLMGWGLDPDPGLWRTPDRPGERIPELLGGAQVQVVSGRRTKFTSFAPAGKMATAGYAGPLEFDGRVAEWGGGDVSGGKVLVELQFADGRRAAYADAAVKQDGSFTVIADPGPWKSARAYLLSVSPWADSESALVTKP